MCDFGRACCDLGALVIWKRLRGFDQCFVWDLKGFGYGLEGHWCDLRGGLCGFQGVRSDLGLAGCDFDTRG